MRCTRFVQPNSNPSSLTFTKGNDAHVALGFKDEIACTGAPQPYGEIFVMRYDGAGVEQLTDNQ